MDQFKLKDHITPHVNFFQYAQRRCEHGMGEAGKRKEMLEDRSYERSVCVCESLFGNVWKGVVCVCVKELYDTDTCDRGVSVCVKEWCVTVVRERVPVLCETVVSDKALCM